VAATSPGRGDLGPPSEAEINELRAKCEQLRFDRDKVYEEARQDCRTELVRMENTLHKQVEQTVADKTRLKRHEQDHLLEIAKVKQEIQIKANIEIDEFKARIEEAQQQAQHYREDAEKERFRFESERRAKRDEGSRLMGLLDQCKVKLRTAEAKGLQIQEVSDRSMTHLQHQVEEARNIANEAKLAAASEKSEKEMECSELLNAIEDYNNQLLETHHAARRSKLQAEGFKNETEAMKRELQTAQQERNTMQREKQVALDSAAELREELQAAQKKASDEKQKMKGENQFLQTEIYALQGQTAAIEQSATALRQAAQGANNAMKQAAEATMGSIEQELRLARLEAFEWQCQHDEIQMEAKRYKSKLLTLMGKEIAQDDGSKEANSEQLMNSSTSLPPGADMQATRKYSALRLLATLLRNLMQDKLHRCFRAIKTNQADEYFKWSLQDYKSVIQEAEVRLENIADFKIKASKRAHALRYLTQVMGTLMRGGLLGAMLCFKMNHADDCLRWSIIDMKEHAKDQARLRMEMLHSCAVETRVAAARECSHMLRRWARETMLHLMRNWRDNAVREMTQAAMNAFETLVKKQMEEIRDVQRDMTAQKDMVLELETRLDETTTSSREIHEHLEEVKAALNQSDAKCSSVDLDLENAVKSKEKVENELASLREDAAISEIELQCMKAEVTRLQDSLAKQGEQMETVAATEAERDSFAVHVEESKAEITTHSQNKPVADLTKRLQVLENELDLTNLALQESQEELESEKQSVANAIDTIGILEEQAKVAAKEATINAEERASLELELARGDSALPNQMEGGDIDISRSNTKADVKEEAPPPGRTPIVPCSTLKSSEGHEGLMLQLKEANADSEGLLRKLEGAEAQLKETRKQLTLQLRIAAMREVNQVQRQAAATPKGKMLTPKEELVAKQAEIQQLEDELDHAECTLITTQDELTARTQEVQELQSKIESAATVESMGIVNEQDDQGKDNALEGSDEVTRLETQVSTLTAELMKSHSLCEALRASSEDGSQKDVDTQGQKLEQIQEENAQLKTALADFGRAFDEEVESKQAEIERLHEVVKRGSDEVLTQKLEDASSHAADIERRLVEAQDDANSCTFREKELLRQVNEIKLQGSNDQLMVRQQHMQELQMLEESHTFALVGAMNKVAAKEDELIQLKKNLEEAQEHASDAQAEQEEAAGVAERALALLAKAETNGREEASQSMSKIHALEAKLQAGELRAEELTCQVADTKSVLNESLLQHEATKEEKGYALEAKELAAERISKFERDTVPQLEHAHNENLVLKKTVADFGAELDEATQQAADAKFAYEAEMEQLRETLAKKEADIGSMMLLHGGERDSLKKEVTATADRMEALQAAFDHAEPCIEESKALREQLDAALSRAQELANNLEETRMALIESQARCDDTASMETDLTTTTDALQELEKEMVAKESTLLELQQQCETSEKSAISAAAMAAAIHGELSSLKAQRDSREQEMTADIKLLTADNSRLKEALAKKGEYMNALAKVSGGEGEALALVAAVEAKSSELAWPEDIEDLLEAREADMEAVNELRNEVSYYQNELLQQKVLSESLSEEVQNMKLSSSPGFRPVIGGENSEATPRRQQEEVPETMHQVPSPSPNHRQDREGFNSRWRADINADREAYRVVLAAQKSYLAHSGSPNKPPESAITMGGKARPEDRAGRVLHLLDKWHEALEDEGGASPHGTPVRHPSRFDQSQ